MHAAGESGSTLKTRLRAAAAGAWHSRPALALGSQILTLWNTQGLRAGSEMIPKFAPEAHEPVANPLRDYFDANREGPGIWRWQHYFDIYHRHFARFVGREVVVLEIGVYSGGSIGMWQRYFGPRARIYGADLMPECMEYADVAAGIFIGHQADPEFWERVLRAVPGFDIVIDDGSHAPPHQLATLRLLLPNVRPGGVYVTEDVHGRSNAFQFFISGLARNLNSYGRFDSNHTLAATGFQRLVDSVHLYPFVSVIELRAAPVTAFRSEKHGTRWQPEGWKSRRRVETA
jgi:hypothetical protein